MHILLVDDQPYIQEVLEDELRGEGHALDRIGDSGLLRDRLETDPPELVLMDLYLDGFEGRRMLNEIKSMSPDIPVFIVTAYESFRGDPGLQRADRYLLKDIRISDNLKKAIQDFFGPVIRPDAI